VSDPGGPPAADAGAEPDREPEPTAEAGADSAPAATPPAAAAPHAPPRGARVLRDHLETLLVAILVVLFVTTFVVQNSVIPSASMEDTLLVGDYILVNRIMFAPVDDAQPPAWLSMRPLRHGDVVVFKHPDDPETDYIKRVIGLPGDLIEVRDKVVLRNRQPLAEPYAVHRTGIVYPRGTRDGPRDNFGPVLVPDGMLFVMGDNRDYSRDSREFGFVPRDLVTGRAFVIFWSRHAPPGAFEPHRTSWRRTLASLRTFHRDIRWGRLFTIVR
jgi:signal peptidase I